MLTVFVVLAVTLSVMTRAAGRALLAREIDRNVDQNRHGYPVE